MGVHDIAFYFPKNRCWKESPAALALDADSNVSETRQSLLIHVVVNHNFSLLPFLKLDSHARLLVLVVGYTISQKSSFFVCCGDA